MACLIVVKFSNRIYSYSIKTSTSLHSLYLMEFALKKKKKMYERIRKGKWEIDGWFWLEEMWIYLISKCLALKPWDRVCLNASCLFIAYQYLCFKSMRILCHFKCWFAMFENELRIYSLFYRITMFNYCSNK